MRKLLELFTLSSTVIALIFSPNLSSQTSATSTVLEHYSNPDITREGPVIDTELAQKMYRRGNTYSNLQRYEEAIQEYRKAISADPNYLDAIHNLANTYYFLKQYEETKPLLARYIELETSKTAGLIAAISTLGNLERESKNYEIAINYDLRAIELNPDDDSQIHIMANMYNNSGDTNKAIKIYRAGIMVMPENAFFYRSLGRLLEQENRLDEALAEYQAAAARAPESSFYSNLVDSMRQRLER
jgi:tetratricopeptide (TPR) repeat protein